MPSNPAQIPSNVADLTGPILLGHLFNWALYGVLCVQSYLYYISFPKDRSLPKTLVVVTLSLETLQLVLSTRDAFVNLASGWGNMEALDDVGWQWFSLPILMAVLSCICQFFYAWRIWVLSSSICIPILVAVLSVLQGTAATYVGAVTEIHHRYSLLRETTNRPMTIWFVGTASCDIVIAISTMYFLKKKRTYFRSTTTLVSKLIRVSVETGLICATCAILDVIFFLAFTNNTFYMPMCVSLSKLYSNSLLAVLNARVRILGGRDDISLAHDSTLSGLPPSLEATTFGGALAPRPIEFSPVAVTGDSAKATKATSEEIVLTYPERGRASSTTSMGHQPV